MTSWKAAARRSAEPRSIFKCRGMIVAELDEGSRGEKEEGSETGQAVFGRWGNGRKEDAPPEALAAAVAALRGSSFGDDG
jgi:hypothetical protein